jgi:3-hydroxyisobutyrate dehydrogenase-like beta-hydroxyacid dehydrogenase
MDSAERIGFIGIGLLGGALARRAFSAGYKVLGFDLDDARCAELKTAGGGAAQSAGEVARLCDRIFLVLPHDGVTREVFAEIAPSFRAETVILDATTGDPAAAIDLAARAHARGAEYLEATVSGSSEQVRRGEALFMAGGSEEAYNDCRELLDALAGKSIYAGPCGSGAKMKLVTNLVLGLNRGALAEGLAFAAALGLEPESTLAILKSSAAYSRMMDTKGEKMIRGDFAPQARLSQHLKDVNLMLDSARRAGQKLPLTEAHRELLELAERLGLGGSDNSAILRAIESLRTGADPQ